MPSKGQIIAKKKAERIVKMLINAVIPLLGFITLGAANVGKCPAEPYIPIFLVVLGAAAALYILINMWQIALGKNVLNSIACSVLTIVFAISFIAWIIAGHVWIYRINNNFSTNQTDANYCKKDFYRTAFWLLISAYIIVGSIIVARIIYNICSKTCYKSSVGPSG